MAFADFHPTRKRREHADIVYQSKAAIYDILFKASAEILMTIAADQKHLGAHSVLHTWGSALTHHPHQRCGPAFWLCINIINIFNNIINNFNHRLCGWRLLPCTVKTPSNPFEAQTPQLQSHVRLGRGTRPKGTLHYNRIRPAAEFKADRR